MFDTLQMIAYGFDGQDMGPFRMKIGDAIAWAAQRNHKPPMVMAALVSAAQSVLLHCIAPHMTVDDALEIYDQVTDLFRGSLKAILLSREKYGDYDHTAEFTDQVSAEFDAKWPGLAPRSEVTP